MTCLHQLSYMAHACTARLVAAHSFTLHVKYARAQDHQPGSTTCTAPCLQCSHVRRFHKWLPANYTLRFNTAILQMQVRFVLCVV